VIGSPESLGYQSRIWFNPGDGASPSVPTLSVNGDVFFAIPFTFDTSFNLGLYAYAYSGNTSFGQNFIDNIAERSFQNTVALDGIDEVLAGPSDTPVTNYITASRPPAGSITTSRRSRRRPCRSRRPGLC
jgi:hypothetical protein